MYGILRICLLTSVAKTFLILVDLHTITVPRQPNVLRQDVFDTVIAYLACGVDPEHSVVFLQSHVSHLNSAMFDLLNITNSICYILRVLMVSYPSPVCLLACLYVFFEWF